MGSLIELLTSASSLPTPVRRDDGTWGGRDLEHELDLIEPIISRKRVEAFAAQNIRIKRYCMTIGKKTVLCVAITNGKHHTLKAVLEEREETRNLAVYADGQELEKPMMTVREFSQLVEKFALGE
jgi:hypothetical protein